MASFRTAEWPAVEAQLFRLLANDVPEFMRNDDTLAVMKDVLYAVESCTAQADMMRHEQLAAGWAYQQDGMSLHLTPPWSGYYFWALASLAYLGHPSLILC